jgi:hypothetical protein
MKREIIPFGLRIPEDLKKRIDKAAAKSARSINAEIVARLNDSFERGPLADYADGQLIEELMSRYKRGEIYIRVGKPDGEPPER